MVEATALLPQKSVLENECGRYGAAVVVMVARERKR